MKKFCSFVLRNFAAGCVDRRTNRRIDGWMDGWIYIYIHMCGPGSSVGIATDYGLDGPGSNPVETRFSARPDRPR